MESDWSVECGAEDPWVVIPWTGATENDPSLRFIDLRTEPQRICEIPEAAHHAALAEALTAWNTASLSTVKCDVWQYGQSLFDALDLPGYAHAHASYVDLLSADTALYSSFVAMEDCLRRGSRLAESLQAQAARCEWILRRARIDDITDTQPARDGFACTLYLWGYGVTKPGAAQAWEDALRALIAPVTRLFEDPHAA
jgi:hypothetical protein